MKKNKNQIDKLILIGLICGILYSIFAKYDDQILYNGFSQYYLYFPIIVFGIFFLKRKMERIQNVFIDWLSKFIFSVVLFYIPSMCLFVAANLLYTQNKIIHKVEIVKINKCDAKSIVFELDGKEVKSHCQTKQKNHLHRKTVNKFKGELSYKEGLFGTYVIQNFVINYKSSKT